MPACAVTRPKSPSRSTRRPAARAWCSRSRALPTRTAAGATSMAGARASCAWSKWRRRRRELERDMTAHQIGSPQSWTAARLKLLEKEKAFTRARDELSAARRALPWEKVEKDYVFEGANGSVSLADLFCGKSQLIVYHFM